jgi:hypothetical protein
MPNTSYQLPQTHPFNKHWMDPKSFGFTLLTMYIDTYGTEGVNWMPETIEIELRDDFGIDLSADNFDRLMTAISLLTSNSFFVSLPDFIRTCVTLSDFHVAQNTMILPDADDIAWGVSESLLISPSPDDDDNPFSKEITAFIGQVLDSEGILNPPDVLRIATRDQSLVDRVNYEFSDDPEMFTAIQGFEAGKTDNINKIIRGRMRALVLQLKSLPLRHGKAGALADKILTKIPEDKEPPLRPV